MVGGMISATVLTLFVIPAVFFLWKRATLISHAGQQSRPEASITENLG